ncbi:hypothetical protein TRL7639_01755 [Falsiruegeria litorea R37]|uniref:Uncharacterized protein n=2 Tax=Falsiruegeria litorea TaxID=1280831 RepID=A0A1Y5SBS5_9RHOB|nr:hypothetical protein TRL7639_01755 [Falsiruegeria litorea R37]
MFGSILAHLAAHSILITFVGGFITLIGAALTSYDGKLQASRTNLELKEHVSEQGEQTRQQGQESAQLLVDQIEAPRYSEFHAAFLKRFSDPVKVIAIESQAYPALVQIMKERGTTTLSHEFVSEFYERATVSDEYVQRLTQNLYEFVFGSGQSTSATPQALETYEKLRDLIAAADGPDWPKHVAGFDLEDGLDAIVASVGVLVDVSTTKEDWLIAEIVSDYRRHKDIWGMAIPVAYTYRLLQGALLLSGDITDKGDFFVFGSGITLNTYTTPGIRGLSATPLSVSHRKFFEDIHRKAVEEGRQR